jgi:hypothetical protein
MQDKADSVIDWPHLDYGSGGNGQTTSARMLAVVGCPFPLRLSQETFAPTAEIHIEGQHLEIAAQDRERKRARRGRQGTWRN